MKNIGAYIGWLYFCYIFAMISTVYFYSKAEQEVSLKVLLFPGRQLL